MITKIKAMFSSLRVTRTIGIFVFATLLTANVSVYAETNSKMPLIPNYTNQMHPIVEETLADIQNLVNYLNPDKAPGYADAEAESIEIGGVPYPIFSYMGSVVFNSKALFTDNMGIDKTGYNTMYGFSIPLVGDLNNDKRPEIIVNSAINSSLAANYNGIHILNGQTGDVISTLFFDMNIGATYSYSAGHHQSPSFMAIAKIPYLTNISNNKNATVIVALPRGSGISGMPGGSVSAFEIMPQPNGTYKWAKRWTSSTLYYDGLGSTYYDKGIPQIVDIDGDGHPEVVVYNKIYNAENGNLIFALDKDGKGDYTSGTPSNPHVGADGVGISEDGYFGFSQVYDIDGDGKYDFVAGGKVYYDINVHGGRYKVHQHTDIKDGKTAVADVDGDGIPDVVTMSKKGTEVTLTVWNPGFWTPLGDGKKVRKQTPISPWISSKSSFNMNNSTGSVSYLYIGDIDGLTQTDFSGKEFRLPEIALITGKPVTWNNTAFKKHPNVSESAFPSSFSSGTWGALYAFTVDKMHMKDTDNLKLSFALEHDDSSINTGFTLFDFDNDGVDEICYRDEHTIRILKANKPFVNLKDDNSIIKSVVFTHPALSYTGFEYPVIADINNDASAEMAVTHSWAAAHTTSRVLGVGSAKDKFSPALPVWNQFMYDPFKINTDLTIPTGPAEDRYDEKYYFNRILRDGQNKTQKLIKRYNPYLGNIRQVFRYTVQNGIEYTDPITGIKSIIDNAFEPMVYFTSAYIVDKSTPGYNPQTDVLPQITEQGGKGRITITIGNKDHAKVALSNLTPITIYAKGELNSKYPDRKTYQYTLEQLGITESIERGQKRIVSMMVDDPYDFYVIRLGDSSYDLQSQNPKWEYGQNDQESTPLLIDGVGVADRAFRDIDWSDQRVTVAAVAVTNDYVTINQYDHDIEIDFLSNDIVSTGFTITNVSISGQPLSGNASLTGTSGASRKIKYTHTAKAPLNKSIETITYKLEVQPPENKPKVYYEGNIYIYVLQPTSGNLGSCFGEQYILDFLPGPAQSKLRWYTMSDTGFTNPLYLTGTTITMNSNHEYMVKPYTPLSAEGFPENAFPATHVVIRTVNNDNEIIKLRWTGLVDQNWSNPNNWVDIVKNTPIGISPLPCVDVEVTTATGTVTNLPEIQLMNPQTINSIALIDRAMVKNLHRVNFADVKLDITLNNNEQNRWVMYSSPFSETFAGDYTFLGGNSVGYDMYIAPYSVGNTNKKSSYEVEQTSNKKMNMPFMFYLSPLNAGIFTFQFPATKSAFDIYAYNAIGNVVVKTANGYPITRNSQLSKQLAYKQYQTAADKEIFDLVVTSSQNEDYVLVTNPFPAYLSLYQLATDPQNSGSILPNCIIWTGKESDKSITKSPIERGWKVSDAATYQVATAEADILIPPFQSFFVKKKNKTTTSITVKMKPNLMTTVKVNGGKYSLK